MPQGKLGPLLLRGTGRKILEHLFRPLGEVLKVLIGVVGECVAASPNQLLRLRVKQVANNRTHLVSLSRGG